MADSAFYGPWRIRTMVARHFTHFQIRLTGTSGQDGPYLITPTQKLVLDVDGPRWDLTVDYYRAGRTQLWCTTERTSFFDPVEGLIIACEMTPDSPLVNPQARLLLHLTCLDEVINPKRQPNPYDFTLPQR